MSTVAQDPVSELRTLQEEAINLFLQSTEIRKLLAENMIRTNQLMSGSFDASVNSVQPATQIISPKTSSTKASISTSPAPPKRTTAVVAASVEGRNASLREVIWELLSRPENINGLTLPEIVDIIKSENSWTSKSEDISGTAYQTLYALKTKDKKVVRGEDKRFYIPEGVVSL